MIKIITEALENWNNETSDKGKLQHAYLFIAIVMLFCAGVIGLINYDLGQQILFIALLAIAVFFINAVAWALLQSFVLLRINAKNIVKTLPQATKPKASATKKAKK